MTAPLRLRLDSAALVHNWRTMDRLSGTAACGAAVKADGYGLGAVEVSRRLADAGCRDFFVSNWAEAQALAHLRLPALSVLHGVRADDMPAALSDIARPVLNTPLQIARWKEAGGGPCDVMVDTGMNRLGVSVEEVGTGLLDGLVIETLMSHLACADEDVAMNEVQRARFATLTGRTSARRMSLANSAGVALGDAFAFDLTRPGLALYGGVPRTALAADLLQVVVPEAQVVQRRTLGPGDTVGYNAAWIADGPTDIAIVHLGYADGYPVSLSNRGYAHVDGVRLPVVGRVSMDLLALNCSATTLSEGEYVAWPYDLAETSAAAVRSQYEMLTGLGARADRSWT